MERYAAEYDPRRAAQEQWDAVARDIDDIRDSLGHPVDAGMRDTLIALRLNGLDTMQSCEGHDDRGAALPWVDLGAPEPDGWKQNTEIRRRWEAQNAATARAADDLLRAWYERRAADGDVVREEALRLRPNGGPGAVRLESKAQEWMSKRTAEERSHIPPRYREEMGKFTAYLKERLFVDSAHSS